MDDAVCSIWHTKVCVFSQTSLVWAHRAVRVTSIDALQRKSIEELHPTLALPLIANASLAFLKHHLALPASQQALIDESLEANSQRLTAAERALAAAERKVGLPDTA